MSKAIECRRGAPPPEQAAARSRHPLSVLACGPSAASGRTRPTTESNQKEVRTKLKRQNRGCRLAVWAVVVLAVALLAAACGGNDSSSGDGGDARAKTEDAALKWAECMREHGVDVPDPEVDSGGRLVITPDSKPPDPRQPGYRRASEACEDLLRKALPDPGEMSKEEEARMRDAALEFTKCMRKEGIDMPDPSTEGGGVAIPVQPNDPAFRRAQEACQDKLPLPGGA